MKKIGLIFILCIYSLSSFGIGIKQFYCCGQLKSTSITFIEQNTKEKCGKGDITKGCCQTRYKSLKVKDSHVAADCFVNLAKNFTDLHLYTPSFEDIALTNQPKSVTNTSHAPPLKTGIPIYILLCIFRI